MKLCAELLWKEKEIQEPSHMKGKTTRQIQGAYSKDPTVLYHAPYGFIKNRGEFANDLSVSFF